MKRAIFIFIVMVASSYALAELTSDEPLVMTIDLSSYQPIASFLLPKTEADVAVLATVPNFSTEPVVELEE